MQRQNNMQNENNAKQIKGPDSQFALCIFPLYRSRSLSARRLFFSSVTTLIFIIIVVVVVMEYAHFDINVVPFFFLLQCVRCVGIVADTRLTHHVRCITAISANVDNRQ